MDEKIKLAMIKLVIDQPYRIAILCPKCGRVYKPQALSLLSLRKMPGKNEHYFGNTCRACIRKRKGGGKN